MRLKSASHSRESGSADLPVGRKASHRVFNGDSCRFAVLVRLGGRRQSQRAVALIITLLMLAVITFLAITFLYLSHQERGSVTTATDQLVANDAAQTALQRAQVQLLAPMLAFTNDQLYGLMVSTNYISPAGFVSRYASYTNVNYNYGGGAPLTYGSADYEQNLENLFYDPRPPVFVVTNPITGSNDFRYYLDLNQNGRDEPNGLQPVTGPSPNPPYFTYYDTNGNPVAPLRNGDPPPPPPTLLSNNFVGDPEWIGILQHPDWPYSPSNQFVARYAYLVVPAGKTLDVNYIYNDAKPLAQPDPTMPPGKDGFLRNEGVGGWEMNLAAFLTDLNTNAWDPPSNPYNYVTDGAGLPDPTRPNQGAGFEDALSMLRYRYGGSYTNLWPARSLFGFGAAPLASDDVDTYSTGPLMTGTVLPADFDNVTQPWSGADNTNHFFGPEEFFDPATVATTAPIGFVSRLKNVGAAPDSYNRYTFYRMLAQLGTDSQPEQNKMNLNYVNVDANGNVVPGMETNLIPWAPLQFFTNAADRLLRTYTEQWTNADNWYNFTNSYQVTSAFGVDDIPVYVSNRFVYSAAVNRLLQLAANMYDATTNSTYPNATAYPYLPSVFRPIFSRDVNGDIFITRFVEMTNAANTTDFLNRPIWDLNDTNDLLQLQQGKFNPYDRIYNVPLVIGAKKGFPNFNEFSTETELQMVRRLEFHKPGPGSAVDQTNQDYMMSISNLVGVELWNSYSNAFPRSVQLEGAVSVTVSLTNEFGVPPLLPLGAPAFPVTVSRGWNTNILGNTWAGFNRNFANYSFDLPVMTDQSIEYWFTNQYSLSAVDGFPIHQWFLTTEGRVQCALVDGATGRIVDYVALSAVNGPGNITAELNTPASCNQFYAGSTSANGDSDLWCTNRVGGSISPFTPTIGIMNQIMASLGPPVGPNPADVNWNSYVIQSPPYPTDVTKAQERFYYNMFGLKKPNDNSQYPFLRSFAAPFSPVRVIYQTISLEANDPLVHYTLTDLGQTNIFTVTRLEMATNTYDTLGQVNRRYSPWGGNPMKTGGEAGTKSDPNAYNIAVKDPGVSSSDAWDFPANKFPNIGWLGRVHRGTPWQTVYLKSDDLGITNFSAPFAVGNGGSWTDSRYYLNAAKSWASWTGDPNLDEGFYTRPAEDRILFDLFTTAINDNATRGQMSVNQTNLAAWSALLSGVIVLTNSPTDATIGPTVIQPAGPYNPANPPPLVRIWINVIATLDNTNPATGLVFPNQTFNHEGDILAAPALTVQSPFLNTSSLQTLNAGGISDEVMERIPQQIMSLVTLSHSPRFVIYAFGQTLHPAPDSIVSSGDYRGLCNNYQVTAETDTRAVVRVDGSLDPKYANTPDPAGNLYPPHIVVEQYNILPPN